MQEIPAENIRAKKKVDAKSFKEELAYRGLMICDNCGYSLTCSASTSKTGKKHHYYLCNNCGVVRIKAEDVHNRIENIMGEITIKKNSKLLYDGIINKIIGIKNLKRKPADKIEDEIKQLELRIRNSEDNFADGRIDVSPFNNIINRYRKMITGLR